MSNVIFNSGDYNKQLALGQTQNGLIYLNPINRNITIGTNEEFINFNELLVNDGTLTDDVDNYTNTSQYIRNHNILKSYDSGYYYYEVRNAERIIGDTTDLYGEQNYISRKLSTLIDSIPYEGALTYNIQNNKNNYTIHYPTVVDKQFNIVIAFIYNYTNNSHNPIEVYVKIYPVIEQNDMEVSFDVSETITPYIYKAFWV